MRIELNVFSYYTGGNNPHISQNAIAVNLIDLGTLEKKLPLDCFISGASSPARR
jgi:hypothetical protein